MLVLRCADERRLARYEIQFIFLGRSSDGVPPGVQWPQGTHEDRVARMKRLRSEEHPGTVV